MPDRPPVHRFRSRPTAKRRVNLAEDELQEMQLRKRKRKRGGLAAGKKPRQRADKPRRKREYGGPLVSSDVIDAGRSPVSALPSRPAPELRASPFLPSLPAAAPAASPDMMSTAQGIINAGAERAWRNRAKQAPIGPGESWGMGGGEDFGLGEMRRGGRTKPASPLSRAHRTTGRSGR
jgi:hypothetical protein